MRIASRSVLRPVSSLSYRPLAITSTTSSLLATPTFSYSFPSSSSSSTSSSSFYLTSGVRSFATEGGVSIHRLMAQRKKAPKKEKKKQAGSVSGALLRTVVPERPASATGIYAPAYPRNTLGDDGIPVIELYKSVKASGEDPVAISKQIADFAKAIDTDSELNIMIKSPPSAGGKKKAPVSISSAKTVFPFMAGKKRGPTKVKPRPGLFATKEQRDAKLTAVFTQLKLSKNVQTFIKAVKDDKDLLLSMRKLQSFFDELARYERNEVLVRITTAEPLNKDQAKKLRTKLTAIAPGQKLVFQELVEPKILAGLTINIGNKLQDLSASSKVRTLQKLLQTQAVA